jgi:hypothetical protein
MPDLLKLH